MLLRVALGRAASRQSLLQRLGSEAAVANGPRQVGWAHTAARRGIGLRAGPTRHLVHPGRDDGTAAWGTAAPANESPSSPVESLEEVLDRASERPISGLPVADQVELSQSLTRVLRRLSDKPPSDTTDSPAPPETLQRAETLARQCYVATFRPGDGSALEATAHSVTSPSRHRQSLSASIRARRKPYRAYLTLLAKLGAQQRQAKGKAVASAQDIDALELLLESVRSTLSEVQAGTVRWKPVASVQTQTERGVDATDSAESLRELVALCVCAQGERVDGVASGGIDALPAELWDLYPVLHACLLKDGLVSGIWPSVDADARSAEQAQAALVSALIRSPDDLVRFVQYLNTRSPDSVAILVRLCREIMALRRAPPDSTQVEAAPWVQDTDKFIEVAIPFLLKLLQQLGGPQTRADPVATDVQGAISDLLAGLPHPTPMPVYHALLAHHAREDAAPRGPAASRGYGSRDESLSRLRATWAQMQAEGVSDLKAYQLYMEGVARKGDRDALLRAWDDLRADRVCRTGWERDQGNSDSAGPFPPVATFNHIISLLLLLPRGQGTEPALALFEFLAAPSNAYEPDIITVNTLMRHYARTKNVDAMLVLVDRLPSLARPGNELKPDVVTYTTIIGGLIDSGSRKLVPQLLETMNEAGIKPNVHTFSLLVGDLSSAGDTDSLLRAQAMVEQMLQDGLTPTEVTWTSLINGFLRAGFLDDACKAIARMRYLGIKIDRVTYNMLLRGVARLPPSQDSGKALKKALGLTTSNSRGSGFLTILDAMERDGIRPNEDTWFIILDALVRAQQVEQAAAVLQVMRAKAFHVTPGSALSRVVAKLRR